MSNPFPEFKNSQHFLSIVLISSIIVSAVVGGVFGYATVALVSNSNSLAKNNNDQILSQEQSLISVVEKVSPSVVSIVVSQEVKISQNQVFDNFFFNDPFFRQFFVAPEKTEDKIEKRDVSAGTGFFVSEDGLIVTNKHVVETQNSSPTFYSVITSDGSTYDAELLAKDPVIDLAILKINITGVVPLELGDSDGLKPGQTVVAIGNALGRFSNTVSRGVISGLSRSITAQSGIYSEKLNEVIQTDAAINPGNSGGALINLEGKVIGVNTAVAQGAQSIGFAIPINQAKKAINDVKTTGKITYPFLGVNYVMLTPQIKKEQNLSIDHGALIVGDSQTSGVTPSSPAEKAGLKDGDIVLEIDGKKLTEATDLSSNIQSRNIGDLVRIKILRNDRELILEATLSERP